MGDQAATLRGILERNAAAAAEGESAGYYLNHVTIDIDISEVGLVDEGLEGLPISVEGNFETRDHPESGIRWVLKASSVRADVPGSDSTLSAPLLAGGFWDALKGVRMLVTVTR